MLAIVLLVVFIVLWVVLAIVLLRIVTMVLFLSVASERGPVAPLRRWGVLVGITLLLVLRGMDEGHVRLGDLPSPVHGESKEDHEHDHETGDCDGNACSGAQSLPADNITEANELR
jgi:hypothetical protein